MDAKSERAGIYPAAEGSADFAAIERETLSYWNEHRIFLRSVELRPAVRPDGTTNEFVFYDGPPFANGLPHYGHLVTGFVKDVVPRYQTMRGRRVERRFGWDCHGLPAELTAEKELGLSGRQQIIEYGVERFNAHCRSSVLRFTRDWEYYVTRQGRWVDFQHDYKTMDLTFMESVIWAFKRLWDKGLVYEGHRVVPYSWGAQAPMSNFETRLVTPIVSARIPRSPWAFSSIRSRVRRRQLACLRGRRLHGRCHRTSPWQSARTLNTRCLRKTASASFFPLTQWSAMRKN